MSRTRYEPNLTCDACGGRGWKGEQHARTKCDECKGSGWIRVAPKHNRVIRRKWMTVFTGAAVRRALAGQVEE